MSLELGLGVLASEAIVIAILNSDKNSDWATTRFVLRLVFAKENLTYR